nr:hypothetical protein [Acidipropionibacterium virtanenii]
MILNYKLRPMVLNTDRPCDAVMNPLELEVGSPDLCAPTEDALDAGAPLLHDPGFSEDPRP